MNNDLSALFAKIGAQAKRAVCPGTAVLLRGAQSAGAAVSIARSAQLPLYRIGLNAVTRKYIGETEKNLDAVFDAAERKRAVLFFDEADALFGKRDRCASDVVHLLVQRIAKFHGVVALAAAEASVIDPALRGGLRYEIQLPDLETDVDVEIVADNLRAMAALYFAYMLEEARVFATVDRIAALFASGMLPLVRGAATDFLRSQWPQSQMRLSEKDRRNLYARTLGVSGGDSGITPNRQFDLVWTQFISAVSDASGRASQAKAARDLAANLSEHGYGMARFVAPELRKQLSDMITLLFNPDVTAAFGARDMWQIIDQVSTRELGGTRNPARYATLAVSGAKIVDWLAARSAMLQDNDWEGTDGDLVAACECWLTVGGVADGSVDELSHPMESSMVAGASLTVAPVASELLEALGCDRQDDC